MNDLQDKIVHFAIIFTGIVLYGLLMGLVKGQYSIDFESIFLRTSTLFLGREADCEDVIVT